MNPNAQSVVKTINSPNKPLIAILAAMVVLAGLVAGYFISGRKVSQNTTTASNASTSSSEAGAKDSSAFKDTATGILQVGGIKGEGTYHLDRGGDQTKTVYLTSTVIDMNPFVGKKVQVWGQTQASKYAPWFMDVGKIKVVE